MPRTEQQPEARDKGRVACQCPACATYLRTEAEDGSHMCLQDGEIRFSVEYCTPAEDENDSGNDYATTMRGVGEYAVRVNLRSKQDPENYRITPWVGHGGAGTADAEEGVWGDVWLEVH